MSGPPTLRLPPRALLRFGVRLGVATLLLALVVRLASPEGGAELWSSLLGTLRAGPLTTTLWFLCAVALFGVNLMLGAQRFLVLLRASGQTPPWRLLFRGYVVAGFLNLVVPGAVVGDVYRLYDVRAHSGAGARTLGVLVVERLLALASLALITLIALPFVEWPASAGGIGPALVFFCTAVAAACVIAMHPRSNATIRAWITRVPLLPERHARTLERALQAVVELAQRRRAVTQGFALSLATLAVPVLAVLSLAQPLAMPVAWQWYWVIVPFVTLMSMLPITLSGTGVREGLYVLFFGAVGASSESALALSLMVLAVTLLWGLIGFVILLGSRRGGEASAAGGAVDARS